MNLVFPYRNRTFLCVLFVNNVLLWMYVDMWDYMVVVNPNQNKLVQRMNEWNHCRDDIALTFLFAKRKLLFNHSLCHENRTQSMVVVWTMEMSICNCKRSFDHIYHRSSWGLSARADSIDRLVIVRKGSKKYSDQCFRLVLCAKGKQAYFDQWIWL